MFCPSCGAESNELSGFCSKCGKQLGQIEASSSQVAATPKQNQPVAAQPAHVPNYLVQAILVTIFCCLPFGIVAIVFAAQVNGKVQMGDHLGALQASKQAKLFSWIAFGIGVGMGVISLLYYVFMIGIVVMATEGY